jgi:hypothetical protein
MTHNHLPLHKTFPDWGTVGFTPQRVAEDGSLESAGLQVYLDEEGTAFTLTTFADVLPDDVFDAAFRSSAFNTVYVDPIAGTDAGSGSISAPFKSIAYALQQNGGQPNLFVYCKPGIYNRPEAWKGQVLTANTFILPWPGHDGQIVCSTRIVPASGTYTVNADTGFSGVWTLPAVAGGGSTTIANVYVASELPQDLDEYGVGRYYELAASLAACRATPRTYFVVETADEVYTVTVNTGSTTPPNMEQLHIMRDSSNGTGVSADDLDFDCYISNMTFLGGSRGFYCGVNSGSVLYQNIYAFNECQFKFAFLTTLALRSGLQFEASKHVWLFNCDSIKSAGDNFTYKAWKSATAAATFPASTPVYCQVVEINCRSSHANWPVKATDANNTSNGSTIHDYCKIIRIGGKHQFANGGVLHDTNVATGASGSVHCSLNLSVWVANSQATSGSGAGNTDFAAGQTSVQNGYHWYFNCQNKDWLGNNSTSTYYIRNRAASSSVAIYAGSNLFSTTRQIGPVLGLPLQSL